MQVKIGKLDIYRGDLILVNADYGIKKEFAPNLVNTERRFYGRDIYFNYRAFKELNRLMESLEIENEIRAVSGYRSNREQVKIFDESILENGREFTSKYVALPGHSEHETGLAIDLALNEGEIDFIRPNFPYEGICQDFRKHMGDFGFIERYAKEKEEITKISHEPWHFRYIGFPHSLIVNKFKLSLEEYIESLYKFTIDRPLIVGDLVDIEEDIEIYFLKVNREMEVDIEAEKVEVSGNNIDGVILTVYK